MKTRCLLVVEPGRIELGETDIPAPAAGELLVATELSAISPGTELRCFLGQEEGSRSGPFIPGYSCLGRVIDRGSGCSVPVGARVFAGATTAATHRLLWGGHIAHAVVPEARATVIPEGIDPRAAVLLKLAAIAGRGCFLAPAEPGQTVAVLGLGPIGLLAALIHRASGAQVVGLDVLPARQDFARTQGLEAASPADPAARGLLPRGAAVVVDSTGVPAVLRQALDWLEEVPWDRPENPRRTLVLQGSYGSQDLQLPYVAAFFKELQLVVPRDELPPDRVRVLELMASGRLNIAPLCSRVEAPGNAQAVYAALRDRDPALMTAAFRWNE